MVFTVHDPALKLSVQPAALKQLGTSAPNALQAISQVLASGKVLDVVVSEHKKSGSRGIYLFGQFIPASLPESLRDGERIKVRVSEVTDSLILKIVHGESNSEAMPHTSKLSEVLDSDTLSSLRSASRALGSNVAPDLLKALTDLSELPNDLTRTADTVRKLFTRLTAEHQVITDEILSDPALLQAALMALAAHKGRRTAGRGAVDTHDELSRALEKLLEQISGGLRDPATAEHKDLLAHAADAARGLQDTLEIETLIRRLSAIMGSLGESSLMIMPTIVEGALTTWEMSVPSDRPDRAPSHELEIGDERSFEHVHLLALFPGLGPVKIEIARGERESFIRLTSEEGSRAAWLQGRCPALQAQLTELGIGGCEVRICRDTVSDVLPEWFHHCMRLRTSA